MIIFVKKNKKMRSYRFFTTDFLFQITRKIIRYYNCVSLFFGEYGNPPSCNAWLGQCSIYLVVMFIEKVNTIFECNIVIYI